MEGKMMDRGMLLEKQSLEIRKVELDKDYFVFVRQMTGRERDCFEQSLFNFGKDEAGQETFTRAMQDYRAKLAVNTICDEQGNILLEPADAEMLSTNMSAERLEKIINVVQKINHISAADKESLVKNSRTASGSGSSSGSALH